MTTGPEEKTATEKHPDYELHAKHVGPGRVHAILWLMGRRYEGELRAEEPAE